MDVLIWVLVTLLALVVISMTTVFLVVRAVVKRVRRNRALSGAALRTRARFASGPRGKVLRLRVRLDETLASGRAAVDLAAHGDGPRGELPALFRRIEHEGAALDLQLRLMESETDSAVLGEELPAAGRRVDQVAALVRRLRAAVASGLEGVTDDTLTSLRSEVDREVAALHAGVEELRSLNGHDGFAEAAGQHIAGQRPVGQRPAGQHPTAQQPTPQHPTAQPQGAQPRTDRLNRSR